ncbi:Sterol desaturase [uncultured Candidatus Thioglobus sp.]|nr:Sterol desaturase [uncultured Candidatus Thioglobus sp.]
MHAICLGIFYFYFSDRVELYKVFGASVVVFVFHGLGSNLRHSHVWIKYYPWLERILISPAQHQVHHSL